MTTLQRVDPFLLADRQPPRPRRFCAMWYFASSGSFLLASSMLTWSPEQWGVFFGGIAAAVLFAYKGISQERRERRRRQRRRARREKARAEAGKETTP